jgi:hypothetical protein
MEVQIVVYATFILPKNLSTLRRSDMVLVSPNDTSVRQPLTLHVLHHQHNQPTNPPDLIPCPIQPCKF